MKLPCKVNGKPALIVGYAPGPKGKPLVMVITEGELNAVRLKEIELGELPEALRAKIVKMPDRKESSGAA